MEDEEDKKGTRKWPRMRAFDAFVPQNILKGVPPSTEPVEKSDAPASKGSPSPAQKKK